MTADETIATIDRLGRDVVPAITRDHAATGHRRGTARPHRRGGCDVTAGPLVYTDLVPAFPDPETWTLDHVLRHHVAERPDAVCLDFPEEDVTYTYAEALDRRRARGHRRSTARVRLRATAWSSWPRTRRTSSAPGGGPRSAASSRCRSTPTTRASSCATSWSSPRPATRSSTTCRPSGGSPIAEHARMVERFWVIDTGGGIRDKAVALLRENGWAADALGGARARRHRPAADAEAPGPRRDLLHVRHDRPVQGRRDALLAAVLLRADRRQPHPAHPRRRLPHDHAAVPRQRARSWPSTR